MKRSRNIESVILTIRGTKIILDADLADIYDVPIKVLNQAVKRNADRFPKDFRFQLSGREWAALRSQIVTLNAEIPENKVVTTNRSRIAILGSGRGQHRKYLPYAFTEHGAIMVATVLKSPKAVAMSLYVVRAFIQMREQIAANSEILKRLAEIDKTLLRHDKSLQVIWSHLEPLLAPPPDPPKRRIGFDPSAK